MILFIPIREQYGLTISDPKQGRLFLHLDCHFTKISVHASHTLETSLKFFQG